MSHGTWSATEWSRRIKAGEMKVREAAELVYERIEKHEKNYHCYLTVKEKAVLLA